MFYTDEISPGKRRVPAIADLPPKELADGDEIYRGDRRLRSRRKSSPTVIAGGYKK